MWLMLQQPTAEDYVIAPGAAHRVRELADVAFEQVGLSPEPHVRQDARYKRPAEELIGDYSKASGSWDDARGRASMSWCG